MQKEEGWMEEGPKNNIWTLCPTIPKDKQINFFFAQ